MKEKDSENLLPYVRGKLGKFNPTENQVKLIVDKSKREFLYLSLYVEDIHSGDYSLEHSDKSPDSLNSYY